MWGFPPTRMGMARMFPASPSAQRKTPTENTWYCPSARLVEVKAFDNNGIGTYADIIRGLDWIVANKNTHNIRVVNMSFSGTPQSYYWEDPLTRR